MIRTTIKGRYLQVMVGQALPRVCVAEVELPPHTDFDVFKASLRRRIQVSHPCLANLLTALEIEGSVLTDAYILSRNSLISREELKVFMEENPGVRVCPYSFPSVEVVKVEVPEGWSDEEVMVNDGVSTRQYIGDMYIDCRFKESEGTYDLSDFVELDFYQGQAGKTAIYPTDGLSGLVYTALGLNGEAGEVAEHVKKAVRDDQGVLTEDRRAKLSKEIGDVLWYVGRVAAEAGIPLSQIAAENLNKLARRQEEGKIQGSGSDR